MTRNLSAPCKQSPVRHASRAVAMFEGDRLRRFYESGVVGLVWWDVDGAIVDANDKFLEMFGYTHADLDSGRLHWDNEPPDATLVVLADAHRITQVLANLIGNAIKFTLEGGRVSLSALASRQS